MLEVEYDFPTACTMLVNYVNMTVCMWVCVHVCIGDGGCLSK